jgi:hypothetical protein
VIALPPCPSLADLRLIHTATDVGGLLTDLFQHFLSLYGDADLASVATAACLNDLLNEADQASSEIP